MLTDQEFEDGCESYGRMTREELQSPRGKHLERLLTEHLKNHDDPLFRVSQPPNPEPAKENRRAATFGFIYFGVIVGIIAILTYIILHIRHSF